MDHLGLVAALLKRYQIAQRIDALLPMVKDDRTKTTYGQRVCAMILNGLGFNNSTLYMTPEFLRDKPVESLLGKGVEADDFNDDTLGRGLDELHRYGTTKLFCRVAFDIIQAQGLLGRNNHLDSTSLALFGQYDDEWANAPVPTYGHSKDHRPDLKQIVVSLITNGPAGVPLYYQSHDGNSSDKKTFHESIQLVREFYSELKTSEDFLWVADSALYNAEKLKDSRVNWLTRVPATLKQVKHYMSEPSKAFEWTMLDKGYRCTAVKGPKGESWYLYASEAGQSSQRQTLVRKIEKEYQNQHKVLSKATKTTYGCEQDARKAIALIAKKLKYHRVEINGVSAVMGYDKPGKPSKGAEKSLKGYNINVALLEDETTIEQAKRPLGRFILATNCSGLSGEQMLNDYKEQDQVERGFRFLKDKSFQNNRIFLQNPQRIDALMMVMTLSLLVYNLGQYQFRQTLKDKQETVPTQLGKETQTPTLRWVFQMMGGISCAIIPGQGMLVANITEREAKIIRLMGADAMAIYKLS